MTATTVPPEVPAPDPEATDRYPEVQAIVDRFVAPAEIEQDGGADVAELVAEHFRRQPISEADTDAGFMRLAGLLGLLGVPRRAVA